MSQHDENIEAMKDIRNRLDAVINKGEGLADPTADVSYRHPDPLKHFQISMAKSALRIGAGVALIYGEVFVAGSVLILAEILGIVEELV